MLSSVQFISGVRKFKSSPSFSKVVLSCVFLLTANNVYSQDSGSTDKTDAEEIERIIVSGNNLDSAMSAFQKGDFEVAEIEFKKNAKCALRIERNKEAFVGGLQSNAINNSIQDTASIQSNRSSQNNGGSNTATNSSSVGGKSSNRRKNKAVNSRTCTDRGFQLYMTGLSQIQLGKPEEAEKNLKTASFLNKNIYDAHYRVGLMALLRNDTQDAKNRLSNIQDVLKRCRDCEAKEEIIARIDFLEKALSGEIKLN
jgi:hypothetical protein